MTRHPGGGKWEWPVLSFGKLPMDSSSALSPQAPMLSLLPWGREPISRSQPRAGKAASPSLRKSWLHLFWLQLT